MSVAHQGQWASFALAPGLSARETARMDLFELRREYAEGSLDEGDLTKSPFELFRRWLDEAVKRLPEANAMVLSTCGADGQPSSRVVLLKSFDERGFVFYTNYESAKARQMAENAKVSVLFPWFIMERQVVVRGSVEKVSTAESLRYFLSRPFASRLGAWTSPQSHVITSRSILDAKLDEVKKKFASGEVPLPSFWGGYRVMPTEIEFWQGRRSRLHDRFLYKRDAEAWTRERLAP
ncbi:MAG TPA: pyridoxamine 5'-phosphate oxidase [Opitutales bacterium]|nr:pyridoxamine 5'-phosphate oxidase [Opitutales bacterium]